MDLEELKQELKDVDEDEDEIDLGEAEAYHQALDLLRDCQLLLDFVGDLDIRKRLTATVQKQMLALADEIDEFLDGEDEVSEEE